MNDSGLNTGASGNLSVRTQDGMLITPSGIPYDDLVDDDIATVRIGGDEASTPAGKPSSEWRMHRDLYRARTDVMAIVHAHPPYATTLACLRRDIPPFHYEVAFGGGSNIRCAEYATFGTQTLSDSVVRALDGRHACLMANHGMVCLGRSLDQAMNRTRDIEFLARTYWQCLAVGEPVLLSEEEMERNLALFGNYGPDRL